MNVRALISFAFVTGLFLIVVAGGSGCANIVPPQGGFRDSLPPILTKVNPADSSVNFSGNKISLSFDEFVQVDNFEQNVIVSPVPKKQPSYTNRLNTITIHLKDTLEPNTTYSINFGDAIKDVNEGNIMKNFTYLFSTGPTLDALSFGGHVLLAETGQVDTTLTVMLFKNPDDSALVNDRPRYVTKLDSKGNFAFRNLPPGTFYLYALEDNGRSYHYFDKTKLFAFTDSPVVVQQNTPTKTLYAYRGEKPRESASTGAPARGATDRRLKLQTNLKNGNTQDLLQKLELQFEKPLKNFDSTKARLTTDTTYRQVTGYSWTMDSTKKKLTLTYSFAENTSYHLVLQKDFASDTSGLQLLRPDTIHFRTMRNADYGKLVIRFRNLDLAKNPVLQFVSNNTVVSSYPLTGEIFSQALFLPGEYELRLLFDANKNGVWDPGQFFGRRRQPELVKPIQRKSVVVKANFDNEIEIKL